MKSRLWFGFIYNALSIDVLKAQDYKYLLISCPYMNCYNKLEWAFIIRGHNQIHKPKIANAYFKPIKDVVCERNYIIEKGVIYERGLFTVNPATYYGHQFVKKTLPEVVKDLPQEIKVECLKRHCLPPLPLYDRT